MADMMGYTEIRRYHFVRYNNGFTTIAMGVWLEESEKNLVRGFTDFVSAYTAAIDYMHQFRKKHTNLGKDNWVIIGTEFHVTLYRKD